MEQRRPLRQPLLLYLEPNQCLWLQHRHRRSNDLLCLAMWQSAKSLLNDGLYVTASPMCFGVLTLLCIAVCTISWPSIRTRLSSSAFLHTGMAIPFLGSTSLCSDTIQQRKLYTLSGRRRLPLSNEISATDNSWMEIPSQVFISDLSIWAALYKTFSFSISVSCSALLDYV